MLTPVYTTQFKKDLKKYKKANKDFTEFRRIINCLLDQEKLTPKQREHKLTGNYKDRHECHIAPDWLLIYKKEEKRIIFERTGSHSDLFK